MIEQGTRTQGFFRDLLCDVEEIVRGMGRYRWRSVIVMWVVGVLGTIGVYSLPDTYRASARIFVDTETAIQPILQGIAAPSDVMSEVTVVTREMVSRPILAEVARATGLQHRAVTDEDFDNLLVTLSNRIEVSGSLENIYSIAYADFDRHMAIKVVDSLVNTFVQKSLGGNWSESDQAQEFLRQRIAEYEQRLTEAEDRVAEFKRRNAAVMPRPGADHYSRMQAMKLDLQETDSRLQLAEQRREELIRQLEGEEPTFGIMSSRTSQGTTGNDFTSATIRDLEAQLEVLRLQYTDRHPRIGQLLETIESLKQQQAEIRARNASAEGPSVGSSNQSLALNPVYQNMRIQLTNAEVEIASLRTQRLQQQNSIDELQRLVDTVPQVEAELGRLNRDYDVVKIKYEQLLQQLESADIGKDVKNSIDEILFRVIEPPYADVKPAGPFRGLLMIGVFVVAVGAALAVAFFFNLLNPVYFASRTVAASTGIPVLGSVNLAMTAEDIKRIRNQKIGVTFAVATFVACIALVSVFANQLGELFRLIPELSVL